MNEEMIIYGQILEKTANIFALDPKWFEDEEIKKAVQYVQECEEKGEQWDFISIGGSPLKKCEAIENAWLGTFEKRREELIEKYKLRETEKIKQLKNTKEMLSRLQALETIGTEKHQMSFNEVLDRSMIEASTRTINSLLGASSGFSDLDKIILGQVPSKFVVVGGYNNHGKTTLAINFMVSALKEKKKCVFFSLEMGDVEIINKAMSTFSGIATRKFMYKNFQQDVSQVYAKCKDWDVLIYNELTDINLIIAKIKELKQKGYEYFYIDYLQNLSMKGKERREILEYSSVAFRVCALQEKVFICALSQIGEASFQDTSGKSGLKGSGDISASSDVTIKVVRNIENGLKDSSFGILVSKNRYGQTGYVECTIYEDSGKIYQIAKLNDV